MPTTTGNGFYLVFERKAMWDEVSSTWRLERLGVRVMSRRMVQEPPKIYVSAWGERDRVTWATCDVRYDLGDVYMLWRKRFVLVESESELSESTATKHENASLTQCTRVPKSTRDLIYFHVNCLRRVLVLCWVRSELTVSASVLFCEALTEWIIGRTRTVPSRNISTRRLMWR